MRNLAASGIVLALLAAGPWTPSARALEAGDLFGVTAQGGLEDADFVRMRGGGVRTLRVLIEWRHVEPVRGRIDFAALDPVFAGAARQGIRVAPFVYGTPEWLAPDPSRPPIHNGRARRAWRSFLTGLVERYGRHGALWRGPGRSRPVRQWQIWNEPNLEIYWSPTPAASEYARLVRISAAAIRAADPRAEIALAGLARTRRGTPVKPFLARLLSERRLRSAFEIVAVHPYAGRIETLRRLIAGVRAVIARAGERRARLAITELGWASAGPHGHALVRGPRGQARMLRRSFELLAKRRDRWSLERVEWFAWRDADGATEPLCDFCPFAGLLSASGVPKPAWNAFRRFTEAR